MDQPKKLGTKGKALWKGVMSEWVLEKKHDLELLEQAARCLDRIENARNALETDGEYLKKGEFKVVHPAVKTEKEFLTLFFRAIKQLDLNENKPKKDLNLKKGRGL